MKVFALAAIAVGAFMAFVAATSAMAVTELEKVVLCKANEDPCANGHFGSNTVIHELTPLLVLSGIKFMTCKHVKATGTTTELLAHGNITSTTYLFCEQEGEEKCTVTAVNLNYLFLWKLNSNMNGYEQTLANGGNGRPGFRQKCGLANCVYGANEMTYTSSINGGVTQLTVNQTVTGEGICFSTSATLQGTYTVKCLEGTAEVNCYPSME